MAHFVTETIIVLPYFYGMFICIFSVSHFVLAHMVKQKHSLMGKSLIPVIAKVKAMDQVWDTTLARLELRAEFERPTGNKHFYIFNVV